jgi:hypothetical protein
MPKKIVSNANDLFLRENVKSFCAYAVTLRTVRIFTIVIKPIAKMPVPKSQRLFGSGVVKGCCEVLDFPDTPIQRPSLVREKVCTVYPVTILPVYIIP